MADSVYRVTDVIGVSSESWERPLEMLSRPRPTPSVTCAWPKSCGRTSSSRTGRYLGIGFAWRCRSSTTQATDAARHAVRREGQPRTGCVRWRLCLRLRLCKASRSATAGRPTCFGRRTLPRTDLASGALRDPEPYGSPHAPKASEWAGCRSSIPFDLARCRRCLTARNPWPFGASARFRTVRRPQLEIDRWTLGRPLSEFVSENGWAAPAPA